MQTNIEAVISARFDQLLGKERLEQEIEESAKKISSIGSRVAQSATDDIMGNVPGEKLGAEELKSFDKIQRAFEASGKLIDEKSKELLQEFDYKRSLGMTETQWKSFEKRFTELGSGSSEEMKGLEQFIRREYSGERKQDLMEKVYKLWDTGDRTPENIDNIKELVSKAIIVGKKEEYFDAIAGAAGKTDFTKDYQDYIRKAHAYEKLYKLGDEGEDLLTGYERRRTRGMTEQQEELYADKFGAYKERIEDFRTKILPKFELPETEQAKIEQSLKSLTENTTKSYDQIKNSIQDTINTQDNFFKQLQQAGYIAIASGILNQAAKVAVASSQIEAKERTAFDFTSPVGMYSEREQYELFKQNTERSITAASAGMLIGGAVGGYFGGPGGAIVGGSMLSGFGTQLAEIFNVSEKGKTDEKIKYLAQSFQAALQRVEEFRPYEIEATKLGLRFGDNLRGSSGFGYTVQQELGYKKVYGENARKFEEDYYEEQLGFSREVGLEPDEVMRLNKYSRITGQKYGAVNLEAAKKYSEEIFGAGADSKRVIDILENISQINLKMLEVSANAESREAMKMAAFPAAIFGIDNPYGRLGDLGQKTVGNLEPMGRATSEAHEAFLFQAYSRANGGQLTGENGWVMRRDAGLFYSPTGKLEDSNFRYLLDQLEYQSFGDTGNAELLLASLGLQNATPQLKERMAKIATGKPIDIVTGYAKNAEGKLINEAGEVVEHEDQAKRIYQTITGKDQLLAYMENVGKKLYGDNLSEEDRQATIDALFGNAKKVSSEYEKTQERISQINEGIAKKWEAEMLQIQEKLAEKQEAWLNSAETMRRTLDQVSEGFNNFDKLLRKYGALPENKEDTVKTYYNQAYNELYERAYTYINNQRGFDSSIELTDEQLKKKLDSGGRSLEDYEKYLAKLMAAPTSVLLGRDNSEVDQKRYEYWQKFLEERAESHLSKMRSEIEKIEESGQNKNYDSGKAWREESLRRINSILDPSNYSAKLISGFRSAKEQEKLIAEGRGTNASKHLSGYAMDVEYSRDGHSMTNLEVSKDVALKHMLKEIERIYPDIESGAFYKRNSIAEANHFERRDTSNIENLVNKVTEGVFAIKNAVGNFSPNVNLNFLGFSDRTSFELENSRLVSDPRR